MKAIILAAGEGKRFSHYQSDIPKCLMTIGETNLLKIQIDTLHQCGIEEIVIVRGYKKEQINIPGIRYYDNPAYKTTNVLHSLMVAREELKGEVLVLYSDIFYEEKLIRSIVRSSHNTTIACLVNFENLQKIKSDVSLDDIELVDFDSDNRIRSIGKHQDRSNGFTRGQFIGIFKLSATGCLRFAKFYDFFLSQNGEALTNMAWITDLFAEMIQMGIDIHATIIESGWFEVNTGDDYRQLLQNQTLKEKYLRVRTNWDKRSEKYNRLDWVNNDILLERMLANIGPIDENSKILDVGTGTGKILIYLKLKRGDANYHGCDISWSMMKHINQEFGFKLQEADAMDLSAYPDNHFDYITARMCFHHIEDMDRAMAQINSKLKKGGSCIICEGNPPSFESYQFYKEMFFYKEDRHVLMESDMINLFVRSRFSDILTQTTVLSQMSLNNWIENSGLPERNIKIIKQMHYDCSDSVKTDYNMSVSPEDIRMDWKFSIVLGKKV